MNLLQGGLDWGFCCCRYGLCLGFSWYKDSDGCGHHGCIFECESPFGLCKASCLD